MEPKYKLSMPTETEQQDFMKEFAELLDKHSMYYEPVPQFERVDLQSPWQIKIAVFLQKKTEVIPDGSVPSTDPEVNPVA